MKVYRCVLRHISDGNKSWPPGSMSMCDRVFLSEEEARKYFLEQKVEYYKHKQRYSKALSDGKVDLGKMKIFEEILGTDMTSSDIKPYYYELVGVAEIEVK